MKWNCGDFSSLPTPPTQPPAEAPVLCSGANGCVSSKPLCGPNIYCEDLPNNGIQEQDKEDMTMPDNLPTGGSSSGGIDFDANSGANLPTYEETCVPHGSGDGSYVCRFTAQFDSLDMDSITGNNRNCVYSQAMQREYCYSGKIVMDMNGDGEVTPEDLTMPGKVIAGGDGSDGGIDFDVNAATINGSTESNNNPDPLPPPAATNDNQGTGDTTHDHAAVDWAGSGTGECPMNRPIDGKDCRNFVGSQSSQIACSYNNIQCLCALQNYIADIIGWRCRDTNP